MWQLIKFCLLLSIVFSTEVLFARGSSGGKPPNLVLIISDDAGWADFGFQGSTVIPTPHLDQLASRGVRFSNAYAGSVCSPSRASLVTGLYNSRIGYESNIINSKMIIGTAPTIGLSPRQPTIYGLLKEAGYHTGLVGKWHLGMHRDNVQNGMLFRSGNLPNRMGVDEFYGLLGGSRSYWVGAQEGAGRLRHQTLNDKQIVIDEIAEQAFKNGEYVTEVLGNWSVDFIRKHASSGKPFFLCTSFTAPHTPMEAKPSDLEAIDKMSKGLKGIRRKYAAMSLCMDREIGRILQAIEDPNGDSDKSDSIESETLIVFVNDNGGDCCDENPNGCSNGVLRGGKGSSWEGGFRVPMLMAGAGLRSDVCGTSFDEPVHVIDILPTFVNKAGSPSFDESQFDGVDLLPFVNGEQTGPPHEFIYLRRGFAQQTSLRKGKWKLYHSQKTGFKLFDLETNIGESLDKDLLFEHPEVVSEMKAIITQMDAEMMRPNWKVDNQTTKFRFRESFRDSSNWSDPQIWSDEELQTGATTLTSWDGFADTTLIFRPLRKGRFVSTNDLRRQSGLPFMANSIRFRTREDPIEADSIGCIRGEPIVLTNRLDGGPASLQLDSASEGIFKVQFNTQLTIQLFSDLTIVGDGTDKFEFSGGFKELNQNTNIFKKGRSEVIISGASQISGTIEILSGVVIVAHANALGDAKVIVREGGKLVSWVDLSREVRSRIKGNGIVQFNNHE